MSEGHDMSKPNEGHDATTVAVVLNGDFPSLLVLTEFSQQAQKRYEKKLRKQVKKVCKC